jgi:hypothetical protein
MSKTRFATDVSEAFAAIFEETTEGLLVVNPTRRAIPRLVEEMDALADPPTVRVLAAPDPLKAVMDDFIVAGNAADLVARDALEIRTLDEPPNNSLLVSETTVQAVVQAGERVGALNTDDESFVTDVREFYDAVWADASEFSLRTPPLTRVRETLAADIDEETAADFEAVLDSFETARGDGDGLDEVTMCILVAARNGELLYDISKWGEDVGLASKATFSRTKTRLEDVGAIDTEKVPIDVGRPRLRLRLADDDLREADPADLGHVALELLDE